jgi:hypothetical protein
MPWKRKPKVGDWVEVRSKEEILSTLDSSGQLDGMPFMPEMFAFCGKRFQVYKRAHKTCDTVFPVRGRRVADAVHLETRCDGAAHGGCQAGCLLFWKLAWLKPVGQQESDNDVAPTASPLGCTEQNLQDKTQTIDPIDGLPLYACQATRLPYASTDLESSDWSQYVEDYTSGNVGLGRILSGAIYMAAQKFIRAGLGLGRPIRWFYDTFHPLWGGSPYPRRKGTVPDGVPTPVTTLNLKPGELVQVKPYPEILKTISEGNRNRGLFWDAEEVPYCNKQFRVLRRVERIIFDKTGKMQEMKTPCVILDSVICESRYSECRLFCPRSIYPYWREIWLERVADGSEIVHDAKQKDASAAARE